MLLLVCIILQLFILSWKDLILRLFLSLKVRNLFYSLSKLNEILICEYCYKQTIDYNLINLSRPVSYCFTDELLHSQINGQIYTFRIYLVGVCCLIDLKQKFDNAVFVHLDLFDNFIQCWFKLHLEKKYISWTLKNKRWFLCLMSRTLLLYTDNSYSFKA